MSSGTLAFVNRPGIRDVSIQSLAGLMRVICDRFFQGLNALYPAHSGPAESVFRLNKPVIQQPVPVQNFGPSPLNLNRNPTNLPPPNSPNERDQLEQLARTIQEEIREAEAVLEQKRNEWAAKYQAYEARIQNEQQRIDLLRAEIGNLEASLANSGQEIQRRITQINQQWVSITGSTRLLVSLSNPRRLQNPQDRAAFEQGLNELKQEVNLAIQTVDGEISQTNRTKQNQENQFNLERQYVLQSLENIQKALETEHRHYDSTKKNVEDLESVYVNLKKFTGALQSQVETLISQVDPKLPNDQRLKPFNDLATNCAQLVIDRLTEFDKLFAQVVSSSYQEHISQNLRTSLQAIVSNLIKDAQLVKSELDTVAKYLANPSDPSLSVNIITDPMRRSDIQARLGRIQGAVNSLEPVLDFPVWIKTLEQKLDELSSASTDFEEAKENTSKLSNPLDDSRWTDFESSLNKAQAGLQRIGLQNLTQNQPNILQDVANLTGAISNLRSLRRSLQHTEIKLTGLEGIKTLLTECKNLADDMANNLVEIQNRERELQGKENEKSQIRVLRACEWYQYARQIREIEQRLVYLRDKLNEIRQRLSQIQAVQLFEDPPAIIMRRINTILTGISNLFLVPWALGGFPYLVATGFGHITGNLEFVSPSNSWVAVPMVLLSKFLSIASLMVLAGDLFNRVFHPENRTRISYLLSGFRYRRVSNPLTQILGIGILASLISYCSFTAKAYPTVWELVKSVFGEPLPVFNQWLPLQPTFTEFLRGFLDPIVLVGALTGTIASVTAFFYRRRTNHI
ncbi:MAG: hypothetical protein NZO16_00205 [Deltaproteobacteria bacterium]|nr:hypothetical protein [Deltaproteobacteria bacterium]